MNKFKLRYLKKNEWRSGVFNKSELDQINYILNIASDKGLKVDIKKSTFLNMTSIIIRVVEDYIPSTKKKKWYHIIPPKQPKGMRVRKILKDSEMRSTLSQIMTRLKFFCENNGFEMKWKIKTGYDREKAARDREKMKRNIDLGEFMDSDHPIMKHWEETNFSPNELVDIDIEEIGIFFTENESPLKTPDW